jgi:outer membrane protein OmpA-like peptidoglycan-associated protein
MKTGFRFATLGIALALAAPSMVAAQTTNIKGVIVARNGATMTVKAADGTTSVITLNAATNVEQLNGALGLQHKTQPATALINGLPVSVDVAQVGSELDATKIQFKAADLKTAQMVAAGTAQENAALQAQINTNAANEAALKNDVANINKFDTKGTATVLFATNSTALTPKGKEDLNALAKQAAAISNYMISVTGYTDSTGNAKINQQLSDHRAAVVTNYLTEVANVPPFRILSPAALSQSHPAADNETAAGRAENRRVVVNILVSKGLEGM